MNKVLIAVAALAVTFTACEKKKSSILPPPEVDTVYIDTTKPVDTSLTIAGLSDVTTTAWSQVVIPITVTRNNGLEQKVTMSVSGLPEGVKAKFSAPSGYTTFNTNLTLEVGFLAPGTYDLSVMSASETGKSREYNIQLVVDSMTQREAQMLFINSVQNILQTVDSNDSVVHQNTFFQFNNFESQTYLNGVVLQFSTTFTQFFRSFISGNQYHVAVDVNLENGTLNIPLQLIQGRNQTGTVTKDFTIEGTGKIDLEGGTYSIEYTTIHDDGGTLVHNKYTLRGVLQ